MYQLYVSRSEDGLAAAQLACREMSENLRRVTQDKQSIDLRTAAELDDLYRTKINLEERLVELIRYKTNFKLTQILSNLQLHMFVLNLIFYFFILLVRLT